MSSSTNDCRERVFAEIFVQFDKQLQESINNFKAADVTDEDIEVVRGKYQNAFQNFYATAFDIVFQKELTPSVDPFEVTEVENNALNLSVTDDDLQRFVVFGKNQIPSFF
jgi:hypothetical protein